MAEDKYVLVVEDDPDIRNLMFDIFQLMKIESASASCGNDGIEALHQHGRPGLILLDLMMPKTDGAWFCAEIKKLPRFFNIPIVILTASSKTEAKAAELSVSGFLAKPFSIDQLVETVYAHIPSLAIRG